MAYDTSVLLSESELAVRRRAVRFFWVVLIASSSASIVGNAMHAIVHAHSVSPVLAAAVATAPPLVLLGSIEGLSLLVKARRRSTLTYWAALAMGLMLGLAAFRLSFDALRDLAVLCGLRPGLAWLWPLVVDVANTQAAVSLLALNRQDPHEDSLTGYAIEETSEFHDADEFASHNPDGGSEGSVVAMVPTQRQLAPGRKHAAADNDHAVHAVIASNRTKQPPEVVRRILALHANGHKTTDIAGSVKLHHTTVSRIIATAMDRRTAVG